MRKESRGVPLDCAVGERANKDTMSLCGKEQSEKCTKNEAALQSRRLHAASGRAWTAMIFLVYSLLMGTMKPLFVLKEGTIIHTVFAAFLVRSGWILKPKIP